MDREQREHYQVVIEAKDMAGQRGGLTGTTVVNITLTDVNDNPPRFTQSKITAGRTVDYEILRHSLVQKQTKGSVTALVNMKILFPRTRCLELCEVKIAAVNICC